MGDENPVKIPHSPTFGECLRIEPCKLYEAIVIIKWPDEEKYNTSAMGLRVGNNEMIYLHPYLDTDTYELLSNPVVELITINFTDDVEIFAIAALSGLQSGSAVEELDHSSLTIKEGYGFLKNSQTMILGKINHRNQKFTLKYDGSSFDDVNLVTTEFPVTFEIERLKVFQSSTVSQPVNRGDNLALEAIVYASKIPAIQKQANSFQKVHELVDKVRGFQHDIRRFSASRRALTVCNIIDNFLDKTLAKPH
ncbi:MAG: DUF447 family protein [Promethearchaeota archaeon]|nr:MAG: DUF447 family protein [Candidatus Lokiarchaeota archaeon]